VNAFASAEMLLMELAQAGVRLRLAADGQLAISAPRGGLPEALRAQLTEMKPVIVERLRQRRDSAAEVLPTIVPDVANRHEPFPMSELQASFFIGQDEGMEFHVRPHHYHEEDHAGLDPLRYEAALNRVLHRQRHNLPVVTTDGRLQAPREFVPLRVRVHDLRGLPTDKAQAAVLATRGRMARQTLPLAHWPWICVEASLMPGGTGRLHVNNNNFFGDGFGTQRLFRLAKSLYDDPNQPLPELTLGYRDCVLALEGLEASPLGEASRHYWEARVPTLPGPPPLPRVPGEPTRVRSMLERRSIRLASEPWSRFKAHAQARGLTLSSALTAVYAEVVATWSGSRHFVLNHMATHRFAMHPEIREVLGNFASLYPLEVDWRDAAPFAVRARCLQDRLTEDMQHLYWSGNKVLQALNQSHKSMGRAPCPFVVGSGLFMSPWEETGYSCLETPQTLLDYQFWETTDNELLAVWDVIERQFPPGLIDAMQAAYERLLGDLADDASAWSRERSDLLPEAQRAQRAVLNCTDAPLPTGLLQQGLVAAAQSSAQACALVAADRAMGYGELRDAAAAVAHRLQSQGIGRGHRVAVLLDKGWQQVVAVHGVLAAGAAYVPIDPRWPRERIELLLRSVQASAVLDAVEVNCHQRTDVACDAQPGDLAYVIFTSGSTGQPKGVMIEHAAALNTVVDVNRRFGIGSGDVVYGISSLCFDLSVFDLFGSALAGATLVLPEAAEDPRPAAWLADLQRHRVTVWNSVPALMQLLVDAAEASDTRLPDLRLVMLSGDWIPVSLPARIRRIAPQARVVSLGGATEAAIWSIFHPADTLDPTALSVPYGKPLAWQTWHVLDELGHDAPTWVPGALYIGGAGLARGYWGDPAKTDAAFVPHPQTGERLYRTGDLGRYLPDGSLEFLGRADFQVKVQGYRVELGEIEAAMLQVLGVQAAAVIATSAAAGRQLAGFYVGEVDAAALRGSLLAKLPSYMVPSQLHCLAALPLTANGKLDRQALARAGNTPVDAARFHVPARNDVERRLAALWEEVLGVRAIGVTDDFFDLGGQSFAAVRLMTRIGHQFGRQLSFGALLEDRTIEALARRLERHAAWSPLVPLHTQGEGPVHVFVHPAGGTVMCYRALAQRLQVPFYALQAQGLEPGQAVQPSIEAMASQYLTALHAAGMAAPLVLGGWSSGGLVAFEMARQIEARGDRVERVVMVDAPAPMQALEVTDATLLRWFLEDLDLGLDLGELPLGHGNVHDELARVLPRLTVAAGELDGPQLGRVLDVFRTMVRAGRRYEPGAIDADILVLKAREMRVTEFADHPGVRAADWGWRRFANGRVTSIEVAGTHHDLLREERIERLVQALRRGMEPTR
jgi:amino acid adenylation domain-containing protein